MTPLILEGIVKVLAERERGQPQWRGRRPGL